MAIKLFLDANLKPSLLGEFKYHIHNNRPVPESSMKLWKRRGFNPVPLGIAHVRFEKDLIYKFTYPAYFYV